MVYFEPTELLNVTRTAPADSRPAASLDETKPKSPMNRLLGNSAQALAQTLGILRIWYCSQRQRHANREPEHAPGLNYVL